MVFLFTSFIGPITASYIGDCRPLLSKRGKVSTTLTTRFLSFFSLRGYYNISVVSLLAATDIPVVHNGNGYHFPKFCAPSLGWRTNCGEVI